MKKFACSLAIILLYSTLDAQFEQASDTSHMRLASALDIWVILGSIHELGEGFKPMNSLYVINPDGKIEELYREYKKLDVDFIFQSFYNARQKPGGIIEVDKPGSL